MTSPRTVLSALAAVLLILLTPLGQSAAQDEDSKRVASYRVTTAKAKIHRAIKRRLHPAPPEAILLKDLATGRILFEQHATEQMPPASLTKIMSAIVILSEGNLDDAVMISRRAAAAKPTKIYLKPGQIFPLQGLLEAMLIRSANDACLAAAEHIAGTEEAFVLKMNAKAKELGLAHTQFRNACGFNMDGHYSTAEELARLTEYAMGYETFSTIVKAPMAVLRSVNQSKVLVAHTTNRLLGLVDGVIGVKTGYTKAAGRCLITVVRRGDKELLLVLLNSRRRWSTAQTLLEGGLRDTAPILSSY
jgi:serine-type D-Ala-D-Ala carboxypeptidase (penicillin-binding protein 5/6)